MIAQEFYINDFSFDDFEKMDYLRNVDFLVMKDLRKDELRVL